MNTCARRHVVASLPWHLKEQKTSVIQRAYEKGAPSKRSPEALQGDCGGTQMGVRPCTRRFHHLSAYLAVMPDTQKNGQAQEEQAKRKKNTEKHTKKTMRNPEGIEVCPFL